MSEWVVHQDRDGNNHVIPTDELHDDEACTCWCQPKIVDGVIVHYSIKGEGQQEANGEES